MCIQNNYNPLNLEFAFPKTSAKKFQTIELDLIDACQLKCPLCLRQERKDKKFTGSLNIIALKQFFNNIKNHKEFDIKLVRLVGTLSEPTLYPKLLDIVKYIKSKNKSIILSTNGNTFATDSDRSNQFWESGNR